MDLRRNRLKQLDMLGAIGAGVLGAGVALLFKEWLFPYAVPAVLIGIAVHGWAMYAKHRLEIQSNVMQAMWEKVTYRGCWLMVLALIGYITLQLFV
ncbi:hypothetical protein EDC30_11829 [Paucimonas lemoignei]|uniref:Uncharacterized protein n=1 Tax=Paucimonas lemoignei TaxID=29443 RepID=A0A4R3HPG5_PAULE|nr:hypothetical protein [Paucimonas lemoignei]TCS33088.1 hypothetical protein EDC30_11829 [Paucimonas lemoignei]